jgi:tRNA 2-selenouridine synthase
MFESLVWAALRGFDRRRPVYVEAESRKIGALRVPESLIQAMWAAECILLEAPDAARVELLKLEYAHFFDQAEALARRLECLLPLHGHAVIGKWKELAAARRWDKLIVELLVRHYDPAYTRSTGRHYAALPRALKLALGSVDDAAFAALARRCLETEKSRERASA